MHVKRKTISCFLSIVGGFAPISRQLEVMFAKMAAGKHVPDL